MQPEPLDAPLETPIEDAAEQAVSVGPEDFDEDVETIPARRGLEVNEWDATEQARTVDLDDDYR